MAKTKLVSGSRSHNYKKRGHGKGVQLQGDGKSCFVCGGALFKQNKTGICVTNERCQRANRQVHDGTFDPGNIDRPKRRRSTKNDARDYPNHPWMLKEVRDLDTGEIIVDRIAVQIATEGTRKVRLTRTEQKLVIERMNQIGYGRLEMRQHIGIDVPQIDLLLDEMGYDVVDDPAQVGAKYPRKLVTRKDRPRGN